MSVGDDVAAPAVLKVWAIDTTVAAATEQLISQVLVSVGDDAAAQLLQC